MAPCKRDHQPHKLIDQRLLQSWVAESIAILSELRFLKHESSLSLMNNLLCSYHISDESNISAMRLNPESL